MKYTYRKAQSSFENNVYRRFDGYIVTSQYDPEWVKSMYTRFKNEYNPIPDTLIKLLFNHIPEPSYEISKTS